MKSSGRGFFEDAATGSKNNSWRKKAIELSDSLNFEHDLMKMRNGKTASFAGINL